MPPQQNYIGGWVSLGVVKSWVKRGRGFAYAEDAPGLDGVVLGFEGLDKLRELVGDAGGRVLAEESAQVLLLLGGVGRVPAVAGLAQDICQV